MRAMSKKSPKSASTTTFLISPHSQIVFVHASKSQMTYQRTSLRYLITTCTSLTRTSCLSLSTSTKRSASSTSPSRSFHLSLKRRCLVSRPLFFFPASKIYSHQASTCSTWTSNSPQKRSKWPSSQTSASTRTSSTTSASVATSWA